MDKKIIPMDAIEERIRELLTTHEETMNEIWKEHGEEEDLTISMSIKLGMKEGQKICDVGISFIKEKVKERRSFPWDERQSNLFDKGKGKGKENGKPNEKSSEF